MNNRSLLVFRVLFGVFMASVLLLVALILAPDEEPSELSSSLKAQGLSAVDTYAEGFIYQMGLGAPLGTDPSRFGAARITAYQDALAGSDASSFGYEEKLPANALALMNPEEWGNCPLDTATCIQALLKDQPKLNRLISQSAEIFKRYQRNLSLQHHHNTLINRYDAPSPPMQYVTQGNLALRFRALALANAGDAVGTTNMLLADIARQRELLADANTIIDKVIFSNIVTNDITTLNTLQALGLAAPSSELPALTRLELSFAGPLAWEFAMNALLFEQLSENRNAFSYDFEVPEWVVHAALKKNMFLNQLAVRMSQFTENSEQSLETFSAEQEPSEISWFGIVLNPLGSVFTTMIDETNYNHYSARTQDLGKQILLFNHLAHGSVKSTQLESSPLGFHRVGESQVCFDRAYRSDKQSKAICLLTSHEVTSP
ncbi:hypothetical protein SAMN05216296_0051 [Pseudomonas pohangensis]|uniref:Uncharacterized protein n=1 Tax=Pseudomonas pohangensis TaxID=364197 RepID=A0A1H2DVG4_9PSED|nr:hypothetical protein [Pseudomonas pohangensis]SDT86823.1 hypothetical protein SAMN05216296_0051 [Pseudomonas pohangensis]